MNFAFRSRTRTCDQFRIRVLGGGPEGALNRRGGHVVIRRGSVHSLFSLITDYLLLRSEGVRFLYFESD